MDARARAQPARRFRCAASRERTTPAAAAGRTVKCRRCEVTFSKVGPDIEMNLPAVRVDGSNRICQVQAQHAHGRFPAYAHARAHVQSEILAEERITGIDENCRAEILA